MNKEEVFKNWLKKENPKVWGKEVLRLHKCLVNSIENVFFAGYDVRDKQFEELHKKLIEFIYEICVEHKLEDGCVMFSPAGGWLNILTSIDLAFDKVKEEDTNMSKDFCGKNCFKVEAAEKGFSRNVEDHKKEIKDLREKIKQMDFKFKHYADICKFVEIEEGKEVLRIIDEVLGDE